jgi:hypothetical protein
MCVEWTDEIHRAANLEIEEQRLSSSQSKQKLVLFVVEYYPMSTYTMKNVLGDTREVRSAGKRRVQTDMDDLLVPIEI